MKCKRIKSSSLIIEFSTLETSEDKQIGYVETFNSFLNHKCT